MDNQFLLLIALTPQKYLNPLRIELQRASLNSIRAIEYDNVKAIILGDEEKKEGNLHFIKVPDGTKGDRLAEALTYLSNNRIAYDYIARFDDDDLFNPSILETIKTAKADCIADKFHAFYDLNSHRTITSKKEWMANTVFMKKVHALAKQKDNRTLIEQDHAEEWHLYFKGKTIEYPKQETPLYIRVLSPTSITANAGVTETYSQYLHSFGNWAKPSSLKDFEDCMKDMESVHNLFYPNGKYQPLETGILQKIKNGLRALLGRS